MRLFKLGNGNYALEDNAVYFEGPLEAVSVFMQEAYETPVEHIERALDDMRLTNRSCASFGIFGEYICCIESDSARSVLLELKAIQEVRREFTEAHLADPTSLETKLAANRLQSLYIALNVDKVIALIESQEFPRLAA